MSENSKIEWTDSTWNFLVGCDKVSAGCKRCYAIQTSWIRQHNPKMNEKFDGVVEKTSGGQLNWTGRVNISESTLSIPLKKKKDTKYFVNSLSDLFHDSVPFEVVDRAYAVMAMCGQHTFQILTKRPKRMLEYYSRPHFQDYITTAIAEMAERHPEMYEEAAQASLEIFEGLLPLFNVHIGVSCEDQNALDERLPFLMKVPAAVRFLSCEPLLGSIDLSKYYFTKRNGSYAFPYLPEDARTRMVNLLDWVIVGGESGKGAAPMHPDWARSLRDQCKAAGVAFFFKQWGEWREYDHDAGDNSKPLGMFQDGVFAIGNLVYTKGSACMAKVGKKAAGRLLDGVEHNEFPNSK